MASINKRGPSQWQAQVRRRGYPPQTRTFESQKKAEEWARSVESEMDKGCYIDRSEAEKTTLYDLLKRYKNEVSPSKRGSAVEVLRIEKLMATDFAKYKMAALSSKIIAEWRDQRLIKVSPSTVRREIDILSAVINQSRKEWGIHIENPIALIRRPAPSKARDRRLSEVEEKHLMAALDGGRGENGQFTKGARNRWIKPLVRFAIETAMRRGEMLSLQWENVDLDSQTAHLELTKNGESRTVPLSSTAVLVLRELNLDNPARGPVFPITENALKHAFVRSVERARQTYEEECKEVNIEPDPKLLCDLHFHDLRHEATSRIAEKLSNVLELSAVTGHKELRMLKRYYHPKASDLAKKLG